MLLAVAGLALLFPLLIFIGAATRLAAARREQRLAAIRLVGGTPQQISVISAVESSTAAIAGVILGFGVFLLLRPALTNVPITGAPSAPGDLSLNVVDIVLVAIGVPAGAAVAALAALRRVQVSPLGVSRRVTPPAPSAFRVVPLILGIAELAYFTTIGHPKATIGQTIVYVLGFLLILTGLVAAGPWLTMTAARIMAQRASGLAVLIAGRRLADNPRGAFRSISGLILALFITSIAVGATTTINAGEGPANAGGKLAADTLNEQFCDMAGNCRASTPVPAVALAALRSIPGAQVTLMYTDPLKIELDIQGGDPAELVSCAQLARTPALGRCAPGTAVAAILPLGDLYASNQAQSTWPAANISLAHLQSVPIQAVIVGTNGSTAAIERARTILEAAYPALQPPSAINQQGGKATRNVDELGHLAEVVIIASLIVAGCSLAVSRAGALSDRKRPFSLLRLAGVRLGLLRRVVTLETAVPLLVTAVISIGTGFLAAELLARAQLGESVRLPGPEYYIIVTAGLAGSLGAIALTFPLLKRITGPETARNE